MSKIIPIYFILLLFSSILSDDDHKSTLDVCLYTDANQVDCRDPGPLNTVEDKLNYVPDACCKFDIAEIDNEMGYTFSESLHQCLQIKKAKVEEYVDYIYDELLFEPDIITVKCNNVKVYEWDRRNSSKNNILYRYTYLLFLVFLLI